MIGTLGRNGLSQLSSRGILRLRRLRLLKVAKGHSGCWLALVELGTVAERQQWGGMLTLANAASFGGHEANRSGATERIDDDRTQAHPKQTDGSLVVGRARVP